MESIKPSFSFGNLLPQPKWASPAYGLVEQCRGSRLQFCFRDFALAFIGLIGLFSWSPVLAQSNYATPYAFPTHAGSATVLGTDDGTGSAARLNQPKGLAVDSAGNVYVADSFNETIRKITSGGVVTTFAGMAGNSGSIDGALGVAKFTGPAATGVDSAGNVYVADFGNSTIRKITPGGLVSTFAGLAGNTGTTDATGGLARFNQPAGIAVDGSDNVYVADTGNHTIRKITPGGVVTTFAGIAGSIGAENGVLGVARLDTPTGLTVDSSGNVYVADFFNDSIRVITTGGTVSTLAGLSGSPGSTDGNGTAARFNRPSGVAVDGFGNVYVADTYNNTIRRITSGGVVTTLAGSPLLSGTTDSTGSAARFDHPVGIAVDSASNVYVADTQNHTIRISALSLAPTITSSATTIYGANYTATASGGSSTGALVWVLGSGSTASGAAINSTSGAVTFTSAGTVVINARRVADANYNPSATTADFTLTVSAAAQTITFAGPGNQTYGVSPITLSGSSDSGLAVTYSKVSGPCTVSGSTLTITGAGSVVVRASQAGSSNSNAAADVDRTITVSAASATVVLGSLSATYDGAAHGATASTTPASLGVAFTYGGSATVPTNAGTYAVIGTISDANYQGTASGSLVIAKAASVITWAAPADIVLGTALSGAQLNASANVAGSFAYSPASGAVLSAGTQTLNTTFSPADLTNYNGATAQRSLTVHASAVAPVITTQPLSLPAFVGSSVSFTAVVSGILTPTYQWQKDGINVSGATNLTLSLANVQLTDAGSYALIATNSAGTATSRFARLVIIMAQANAITYATTVSTTGVTAGGMVNLAYYVTNVGTRAWGADHYLSIRDVNNTFVAFSSLIGILPGENTTATLNFPAPGTPGTYTYYVQALENGVQFFSTQTTFTLTVLAPLTNSITYNTTTFPVSAAPGSDIVFTYNVTNTGTQAWGANHLLSLKDSNSVTLSSALLTVLAPGASKTVNLSFSAPTAPGTYSYTVQAAQTGVGNFNTHADLTLVVLAPRPNAIVYTRTRTPDEVVPGALLNLNYSLSNAGTQAWGTGHYVSLRDENGTFLSFLPLNGITPGGTTNAAFNFTAPTAPGLHTYYVQALENGIEFFSTQDVVVIQVDALPLRNAITYNATTFPATVAPGATVSFTYNLTNRGTKTWGATDFLSFRDVDNTFLGFPSISGVAPGAGKTVNISFTAPTTPGIYTYKAQGLEDGVAFYVMDDTLVLFVE